MDFDYKVIIKYPVKKEKIVKNTILCDTCIYPYVTINLYISESHFKQPDSND